jgi:hypothetical protein
MQHNTLKLKRFAMHRVPEGDVDGGPELSDVESPHDAEIDAFFRRKVTGAFGQQALAIEPLEEDDSEVDDGDDANGDGNGDGDAATGAGAAAAILADKGQFIPQSRELAKALYDAQDSRNPEGILVVAEGEIDGKPCIAILKLEHEEGVRADLTGPAGQRAFNIQLLHDLLLTEKTRLFKAAVLRRKSTRSDKLIGIACDNQVDDLADFFLEDFLGCQLVENSDVTTERFFEAAEEFINGVDESERQARYEMALLANLQSAAQKVNPRQFARDHFVADDHQPFIDHLQERGVPTREFVKDISLVEPRLKRIGYSFESGTKLIVPTDAWKKEVKVEKSHAGRAKVTIDDTIVGSRARGR